MSMIFQPLIRNGLNIEIFNLIGPDLNLKLSIRTMKRIQKLL